MRANYQLGGCLKRSRFDHYSAYPRSVKYRAAREKQFLINYQLSMTLYRQMGLDIPFIMVSGTGEDLAVAVFEAGAPAYVTKQNLAPLVPAVNRVLRAAREREIRRQSEAS